MRPVFFTALLFVVLAGCSTPATPDWERYDTGAVEFTDLNPETEGSKIYRQIIPDPAAYITGHARRVVSTLYFSPDDSIPPIRTIRYLLKDYDGISAKSGAPPAIEIVYSTRWIEQSFAEGDTARLDYETRGVLYHELTHGFQLEPQGIGSYGTNKVFWAFIEGVADAVRYLNGCFTEADCPEGGSYLDGYRTTGFFLGWLTRTKDADFLRKFNQSTLHVIPWSFQGGIDYALGKGHNIDQLWEEYQNTRAITPAAVPPRKE